MLRNTLHRFKTTLLTLNAVVMIAVLLVSGPGPSVLALTSSERANLFRPFYDPNSGLCDSSTLLSGKDNFVKIYNYLLGKQVAGAPLQDYHVAGILANMKHESGLNELRLQNTPLSVRTPAASVEPDEKLGWGLVQWTPASKVIKPLQEAGKNPDDLATQLEFLLQQLNGTVAASEIRAGEQLIATTNVADAALIFETKYERHKGPPQPGRIASAEKILEQIKSGAALAGATITESAPLIVLDPGHGGSTINRTDPESGLHDGDYDNPTERKQAFAVAQTVQSSLESAGYRVQLTKENVTDSAFLRDRANVGNDGGAALGVSIHTQADKAFGTWQEIYIQKVGLFRGSGQNKQVFSDAEVASKSKEYAMAMKISRDATEVTSGNTKITNNTFDGRAPIEPGNIPLVQLWAKVPWIYLEAGGNNDTSGLNEKQRATYATAITNGVKAAIPLSGTAANPACASTNTQGLSNTITTYAWPDYRGSGYTDMKPEYAQAVAAARTARQYIGGNKYPGVDCGGFVTRVMLNSGYEPGYNYGGVIGQGTGNTLAQLAWVRANWQLVGKGGALSTADLKQGDVAFRVNSDGTNDGHTFMYAGEISGFEKTIASASLDDRAPMAGAENPLGSDIEWYRKK